MATEDFSGIGDVIRKASEALAETLSAVNKAVKDLAEQAGAGLDRDQMVESWLRAARMSKDGMITALEQGFQWWERQVREQARRTASAAGWRRRRPPIRWRRGRRTGARRPSRSAPRASGPRRRRKQAESVQKTLQDGLRAWQRLWEPEKK